MTKAPDKLFRVVDSVFLAILPMRRFFITPEELKSDPPAVTGQESAHITSVLRLKAGDRVVLFDGTGYEYDAAILNLSKGYVAFRILGRRAGRLEPTSSITLALALLKDRKMDLLARQLTELGMAELFPFSCERSIPNPDPARIQARRERWEKIVHESMKQCKRSHPMHIGPFSSYSEIIAMGERFDRKILFWERAETPLEPSLNEDKAKKDTVLAVLGPEGGFSGREVDQARSSGFVTASMGPLVLRAETAAVAAAALLQYCFGRPSPWGFSGQKRRPDRGPDIDTSSLRR